MDWRQVPSLSALRAFEAAARLGSFSAAARELNVTHAAVAQNVRRLEEHFEARLLMRNGSGMAATEAGQDLAAGLSDGFGRIGAACRDLADRDAERPLRLALTPSLAANWLMPRIGDFWARHPDIGLDMVPAAELVDLRADGFDLAIRYGRGPWPGVRTDRLMEVRHAVIAAPGVADPQGDSLAPLSGHTWFLEMTSHEDLLWANRWGLPQTGPTIRRLATISMVIEAARSGHGVAIVPRVVVDAEISRGDLVTLFEETDSDLAYHLLTRQDRSPSPRLASVIRWLKAQAD